MGDIKTFIKNPKIDFLFGYYGNQPVLTKQDKFKPVNLVGLDKSGIKMSLDYYIKKPNSESQERFKNQIRKIASQVIGTEGLIKSPHLVEVILAISMKESRFKVVDVDNLAKSVLDSLKGVVFEDDSQVSTLLVNKDIHPMKVDSILIGVTKILSPEQGYVGFIDLFKEGSEW